MEYMQQHGHGAAFDYGGPYLTDGSWVEGTFVQAAQ
jgi:hypothetical protein